ncbi:tetratricopeptide repeat protein [uncultured Maricaulis sp.]|uniref:tetratricopeptide repeat protein n=1 Tax=uncultured Maricaulis sp. TaxID=174710 RepID=UPI0030D86939
MVDIFEEVDEELRKDKYQDLARQYGPMVLGAAAAIILGTAGYQGWQAWQTSTRETSSDAYMVAVNALGAGQVAQALTSFEALANTGTGSYATLALLQRAALKLEAGDYVAAAELYEQVAAQSGEPLLRDLATLKAVWALWDTLSFSDVDIRLTPLTGPAAPYRYLAREAIAVAALRAGDLPRARREYQFLSVAFDVPQGVARRALEGLALIDDRPAPAVEPQAIPVPLDDVETEQASAGDSGDD